MQVGGPAAQQQEARECQRVGVDHPLEVGGREAEVAADRGQRDVHDRDVEDDHELRGAAQHEGPELSAVGGHWLRTQRYKRLGGGLLRVRPSLTLSAMIEPAPTLEYALQPLAPGRVGFRRWRWELWHGAALLATGWRTSPGHAERALVAAASRRVHALLGVRPLRPDRAEALDRFVPGATVRVDCGPTVCELAPRRESAAAAASELEHDLAGRAAAVDQLERLAAALEREAGTHQRAHVAAVDQLRDLRADLAVQVGLRHHVGAPAGADHLGVLQQQPVDLDLGDRAAGEADHDEPALLAQRAQAVEEAVAADRVEHDVHAAAARAP